MADWQPDPEFVLFLDAVEARAKEDGKDLPREVWAAFMEIRTGSKIGKMFYGMAMRDPKIRATFEEWKKIRNSP